MGDSDHISTTADPDKAPAPACQTAVLRPSVQTPLADQLVVQVYARMGDFDAAWEAGQVPGWETHGREAADAQASTAIDVDAFETPDELESSLGAFLSISISSGLVIVVRQRLLCFQACSW